jgi:acyl carrier protein
MGEMLEAKVLAILTGLFRDILDDPLIELRPTDSDHDIPGFDSAKKVHLVLAVEEPFAIRLRSREIDSLRSVADWTRIICAHTGRAA